LKASSSQTDEDIAMPDGIAFGLMLVSECRILDGEAESDAPRPETSNQQLPSEMTIW